MKVVISQDEKLGWKQQGGWLSLPQYVAEHTLCTMPASLLTALLRAMGIKNYTKLSHYLKAELFLRHMGYSEQDIKDTLENLVVRERKKQDRPDDPEHGADGEGIPEDEAQATLMNQ